MGDFADYQQEATRPRKTVPVCFDRALLSELEEAEGRLRELKEPGMLGQAEEVSALQGRVDQLRAEAKEKSRSIVFEGMGRKAWSDLLAEHPPLAEHKLRFGKLLDHNPETFPAAAMAASCVEPGLTLEQAQWICDELPLGIVAKVWGGCLSVNVQGGRDPFENGLATVPAGAKS